MCAAMTNILVKKGVCQLLALNKFSIQQWLKCIDTIVFDADGVLWHREDVIEGTPETFNALRAMGKQVFICTNHSAMSANGLCNKAQKRNMYTDIHFGYNCGFQTLLVGTGVNNLQDVAAAQKSSKPMQYQQIPDLFVPKLSDLLKFLPSRNG
ncbi:glycerol-3-phosphate phosphatase-like [Drosophila albomicans]|uniref:Glycerol-3-phosphate phosphatase-like n=1 Tax=Drosophila albomicans TaxID=7291 RepID=A0A9C6SV43_DROAB|nr:glycerol-3-phosphate phosphatase-like [Drosophila albomicans]